MDQSKDLAERLRTRRASTARKKKAAGARGKTVVANTPRARVRS